MGPLDLLQSVLPSVVLAKGPIVKNHRSWRSRQLERSERQPDKHHHLHNDYRKVHVQRSPPRPFPWLGRERARGRHSQGADDEHSGDIERGGCADAEHMLEQEGVEVGHEQNYGKQRPRAGGGAEPES